jgi:hypothetical protein
VQQLEESTASESSNTSLPDEENITFFLGGRNFEPSRARTDKQIVLSLSVCDQMNHVLKRVVIVH